MDEGASKEIVDITLLARTRASRGKRTVSRYNGDSA